MTTPYDPYGAASAGAAQTNYSKQIPGGALGLTNATLSTCLHVLSTGQGGSVYGYSGSPGAGNLICSLSPVPTTDMFGNTVPTGIGVIGGTIQGASVAGASIDSTTVLVGSQIQNPSVLQPLMSGGTANSLVHVLTNGNGQVLGYTTSTSSSTFSTSGQYLWTATTTGHVRVQVWGGGAGGGGGTLTVGGESGGGGEYAEEPSYSVTAGRVYQIQVGQGGLGGGTGDVGTNGQESYFQPVAGGIAVIANGGTAGVNGNEGYGGSGSNNTIHFDGGNGAARSGQTGGQGGGGSAAPTGQGNFGQQSTSSTGGAGGVALSSGGAGGAGGNNQNPGANATAPGGGGGGNGAAPSQSTTLTKQYKSQAAYSYWGQDATNGSAGMLRDQNGPAYQGLAATGDNGGNQFAYFLLPYAEIQRDLNGMTVTKVNLTVHCISSYYSGGVYFYLEYSPITSFGNTAPDQSNDLYTMNFLVGRGATVTWNITGGYHPAGPLLQNGGATAIKMGPPAPEGKLGFTGAFDSGENGITPYITVYYHPNGSTGNIFAGSGGTGQVIITTTSASSPTLNVAVASVTSTDAYGNNLPPGFYGPQLALKGSASAPGTVTSSGVIYNASTSGTTYISNPADGNTYSAGQGVVFNPSAFTVTSTSGQAVTGMLWTVTTGTYYVNAFLRCQAGGGGGGVSHATCYLNGSATPSAVALATNGYFEASGTEVNPGFSSSFGGAPTPAVTMPANTVFDLTVTGFVTISVGGTIQIYAQLANASSYTIQAANRSWMIVQPF